MWLYEYEAYVFALSLFCLYPFVLCASGHWVVQCVLCLCSTCCVLRINMISCPWGVATGLGTSLFTALLIPLAPDLQPLTFYPLTIYALTATQWVNLRDYRVNAKTEYFKHLGKHEKEICSHFGIFCALDELWSHVQTKPLISIYFFTSQNLDSVQPAFEQHEHRLQCWHNMDQMSSATWNFFLPSSSTLSLIPSSFLHSPWFMWNELWPRCLRQDEVMGYLRPLPFFLLLSFLLVKQVSTCPGEPRAPSFLHLHNTFKSS